MPTIARTLTATVVLALTVVAPASAEPFSIGPSESTRFVPDLAVDREGTAHIVYQESRTAIRYCRLPRGARTCVSEQHFTVPPDFDQAVGPQIAISDPNVVVALHGDDADPANFRIVTLAAVSRDGGATFAAPVELGAGRAEDVVPGPGTALTGPSAPETPASSDAVYFEHPLSGGGSGFAALGARGPEPHENPASMHVALSDGAPVVTWNKLFPGREPGNASEVWAARWSGTGSIRDGSTWSAPIRVASGVHNSVIAAPPGDAVVTYSRPNDAGDPEGPSGIYATRLNGTTLSQEGLIVPYALRDAGTQAVNSTFGGTTQDPSGRWTTVWALNGRRVRRGRARPTFLSVVSTATTTFSDPFARTAVACDTGPVSSPRAATATDGGGFAVYQHALGARGSEIRAVPIGLGEPPADCGVEPDGRVYNESLSSRVLITRGRFALTIGCADSHVRCKAAAGRLELGRQRIGSRGYSLEPGASRPWRFRLNRAGRQALARRGRLRVRAMFPTRGARATTISLTLVENRGRATR
jgi:hypothetical protein